MFVLPTASSPWDSLKVLTAWHMEQWFKCWSTTLGKIHHYPGLSHRRFLLHLSSLKTSSFKTRPRFQTKYHGFVAMLYFSDTFWFEYQMEAQNPYVSFFGLPEYFKRRSDIGNKERFYGIISSKATMLYLVSKPSEMFNSTASAAH